MSQRALLLWGAGGSLLYRTKLAVRSCHDGIHIYSLDGARELRVISELPAMGGLTLLGFDGTDRVLARSRSHTEPSGSGTRPSFVLVDD